MAGYSFWPVLFGSLPGLGAYQVYRGIEWLAKLIGDWLPATRDATFPPPDKFRER